MFDAVFRDEVESVLIGVAEKDDRISAAAVVGSRAHTPGDRWSDVDLTFAVTSENLIEVLDALGETLSARGGVELFDLLAGPITYRVFLLPGGLQVDLSVTHEAEFAPRGDTFRLLFGEAGAPVETPPRDNGETFGHAVHHAIRARVCIERGRAIQAEYWISCLRTETLALTSRKAGLQDGHARGAHLLSEETQARFAEALVRSLDQGELNRALKAATNLLFAESDQAPELAARVERDPQSGDVRPCEKV